MEDLTEGEYVDYEKEWDEYRALGDTLCDCRCGRGVVLKGDEM